MFIVNYVLLNFDEETELTFELKMKIAQEFEVEELKNINVEEFTKYEYLKGLRFDQILIVV